MKKRFLSLCAAFALGATMFSFGGCSKAAENTRMTVDINPSVELMVDKDNKVVSVTALNDDAAIILQNFRRSRKRRGGSGYGNGLHSERRSGSRRKQR